MIHITISGLDTMATQKTLEDLRAAMDGSLKDLCNVKGLESVSIYPNMETSVPTAAVVPSKEAPTQPEATQPEATQPEATQPDVTPTEPVKTFKLEEVRAAANAYRDKHGIDKLRWIFSKYGGEKLKDIPAWNYAALMEEIA